jgi:thioesterase domain-containing protein
LQTAGEEVDQLLLSDSYPVTAEGSKRTVRSVDETWREIALGTNLALTADPGVVLDAERIQLLAREQSHLLGSFTLQHLQRLAAVMANNAQLVPTAALDTFSGDLTLFVAARPTPGLDRRGARPEAWRPFCNGAIIVREIAAEHHQMLSPEAVIQMDPAWLRAPETMQPVPKPHS